MYSALQREQCMKLVSVAFMFVCRRAAVLVAAEAAMMRASNQKDQPATHELSALSVLSFSLSQVVTVSAIRRREYVPHFVLPIVLNVRPRLFLYSSVDPV